VVFHGDLVGYFEPNIENFAYLQFQKDENGPRHYKKRLLSEGFAKEFADKDFYGCHSQWHLTLGQALI